MLTLQDWGAILGDVMDAVSPAYSLVFVMYILAGTLSESFELPELLQDGYGVP